MIFTSKETLLLMDWSGSGFKKVVFNNVKFKIDTFWIISCNWMKMKVATKKHPKNFSNRVRLFSKELWPSTYWSRTTRLTYNRMSRTSSTPRRILLSRNITTTTNYRQPLFLDLDSPCPICRLLLTPSIVHLLHIF